MTSTDDKSTAAERSNAITSDGHRIRDLLARARRTRKAAALELGVDVATVQQWYVERPKPPRMAILALERLIDLQHIVRS